MATFDHRKELLNIPRKPGVYQYWDSNDQLLYIGKAKDLKSRVGSYFVKDKQLNAKTKVLIRRIAKITFTIVDTEIDAWLLENSLIKKHQPRYNIMLKDDKTYPWIVIKNEPFPRIFWTRRIIKDGSTYFGPYASVSMMHTILNVIKEIFPIRTCNLKLNEASIKQGKYKVCLEYQIGNCMGPCEDLQSEEDYLKNIELIKNILQGKTGVVVNKLKEDLERAVNQLNFEEAQHVKHQLVLLSNYQSKSTVVSTSVHNVDVFSIASEEEIAFVNFLKVMNGAIIQTQTIEIKKRLDESDLDLLTLAIPEFRARFNSTSKEIVVPFEINIESDDFKFLVPQRGEKRKLLELSQKNVLYFKKERMNQYEKLNPQVRVTRLLTKIKEDLRMKELPQHIECFDNSNIQGEFPVSAVVVFRDGRPSKKEYRHFNVKTVVGPDDYATMEEAVHRRYKRILDEEGEIPQLIVIDGGKGQLSSALKSLKKLGIEKDMAVIAIAERLDELYYPGDPIPLHLDKRSETLKVIQRMRDEAHRFGITFHRNQRSRKTFKTELVDIPGIGKITADKLLKEFKSVKRIKVASEEELRPILSKKQIQTLKDYFLK